ncbi:uncharacterized protein L201_006523 [Kwoniella dendrophila CBS 6074]|uniref:Uncharacterized protein n=1 Tax=Kwoniella dendrophila CBS 6074 TaxID=1295534 RepID=A0AAX4K1X3_9TREE
MVNGQYIPRQVYKRSFVNGTSTSTLSVRGEDDKPKSDPNSTSQDLWLMSHDDFCLYGLSEEENKGKSISESIDYVVSYCSKSGHDTRLIPDGTLKGVTYVKTSSWVQVSGSGDFTQIGLSPEDPGGQFDSSTHNPEGSKLITSIGGDPARNWVTIISPETFCVRACFGDPAYCPTQYDSLGCYFLTSSGVGWDDVWQNCEADDGDPPGVFDGQTYTPGNGPVPTPYIPAVSNCQPGSSISNGQTPAPSNSNSDSGSEHSENASNSSSGYQEGSTTWLPVQTCLPCTATATADEGENSSAESISATSSSSKEDKEGGNSESSSASSASASSSESQSSSSPSSPSAASEAESNPEVVEGTEQVGITKLSLPTSESSATHSAKASITPAPGGNDLSARTRRWKVKRDGEDETITKGDQCCFTTWTPSVIGASSKPTGSSQVTSEHNSGSITSKTPSASRTGTVSGSGTGAITPGASISDTRNNTNGGHNSTNTSSDASVSFNMLSTGGKIDNLVMLSLVTGLGIVLGSMALI